MEKIMVKNNEPFIERRIKSPRSAVIAGIAYSLLGSLACY